MKKYAKAVDIMSLVVEDLEGKRRAKIRVDIGLCYMKRMMMEEARRELEWAMEIYQEEGLRLEVGKVYIILSCLYKDNQLFTTKNLKKAIEIYHKELGPEHIETKSLISRLNRLKTLSSTSLT
jgi:Tfp pilus assembly protein PilF